ncbi:hypothetical protein OROGR_007520 [Orobanche gracilis]
MQEKFDKLRLEKEQTEEMLKVKQEELETRDREQEKLKIELKKLQKMKEFKPTTTFPLGLSLKYQEQEKKDKKKSTTKKPSPPYVQRPLERVKKANPEAEFKEMSTLLGSKWKTITAEEKKPYEEKYEAKKEAYLKVVGNEKREHEAMRLLDDEHKQKTAIAMELLEQYLQKEKEKPKQPISAYFIFSNERRSTLIVEKKNVLEAAKITGEEWKNMTEKQREPYEKMASKNKEEYTKEMEVYRQKKEEENAIHKKEEEELMKLQKQEAMQLLKKKKRMKPSLRKTKENHQKQKKEKNADPNKRKKPASSFFLFSKEARKALAEEHPGITNSTLTVLISVKWKVSIF